jgi:hypothetical protein
LQGRQTIANPIALLIGLLGLFNRVGSSKGKVFSLTDSNSLLNRVGEPLMIEF